MSVSEIVRMADEAVHNAKGADPLFPFSLITKGEKIIKAIENTKKKYKTYMREYMRAKRQGLTGINKDLNVGVRGLEPPTSASRTLRATNLRYTPQAYIIGGFNLLGNNYRNFERLLPRRRVKEGQSPTIIGRQRGTKSLLKNRSPSPLKERGTQGVRLTKN
jgi:hypothetical protein